MYNVCIVKQYKILLLQLEHRTFTIIYLHEGFCFCRDHNFDRDERRKVARKIKFGSISNPSEPSRGALPVRQYHRKDESKILPTKRLGISVDF